MRVALLSLLVVAAGAQAHAQPANVTKEFQAGVDAFRLGKYDQARARLEKARSLDPRLPGPHRFLAAVAHAQERWSDCIRSSRRALELNPASSEIADTRKLHDDCRAAGGREPYRGDLTGKAAIAVVSDVAGATVSINGLTYGGTPLSPRPVPAGVLDVELTKTGFRRCRQRIAALPGIVTDVRVTLVADRTRSRPASLVTRFLDVGPSRWLSAAKSCGALP